MAFIDTVVYVPLTSGLWCLPIECGGSDRYQLYIAFKAASNLLSSIIKEAEKFPLPPPLTPPMKHMFPQINKLSCFPDSTSFLEFEITDLLEFGFSRHLYTASSSVGKLVLKLTRLYSPALHLFCASRGYAPRLYAVERLPGGIIAVAMEHLEGDVLGSLPGLISSRLQDMWTHGLRNIVAAFHGEGLVHGDLRPLNHLRVKGSDRIVLLDFDWGGKLGEASYPHVRLNPQLAEHRDMSNLEITKEDDNRVLNKTLEYIEQITCNTT